MVLLIAGFGFMPTGTLAQSPPGSDRDALVAFYNATDGPNWKNNTNWLSDRPLGEWHGVYTDSYGRVVALEFERNQLSGELPPELGNLADLELLAIIDNQLTGPIPAELGKLSNLEALYLHMNQLSGEIPAELGSLRGLQELNLSGNRLSGQIPPEIGSLTNLRSLAFNTNLLSGQIPIEIWSLTNLQSLDLRFNLLSGQIHPRVSNLADLVELYLSGNQLSGVIPPEVGSLTNLEDLSLASNRLTGRIPSELGKLSNLQTLRLFNNSLSGCIPAALRRVEQSGSTDFGGLPFCEGSASTEEAQGNRPPEAIGSIPDQTVGVGEYLTLNVSQNFRDPEGDRVDTYGLSLSNPDVVVGSNVGNNGVLTMRGQKEGITLVGVVAHDGTSWSDGSGLTFNLTVTAGSANDGAGADDIMPTPVAAATPIATARPTPTVSPTAVRDVAPTPTPAVSPRSAPAAAPTPIPKATPTSTPTATPTATPTPAPERGFFTNSVPSPGGDESELPFDILDPVTLSLIGLLVTLGATAIQLFRGR